MLRPERLLADRQGSPVERLGLGVAALGLVQKGQVVEARGDIGMRRSECLLVDHQGSPVERLCLGVAALGPVQ